MKKLITILALTILMPISAKTSKENIDYTVTVSIIYSKALNKDHKEFKGKLELTLPRDAKFNEKIGQAVLVEIKIPARFPNEPMYADVWPKKKIDDKMTSHTESDGSISKIYNCKGIITKI